MDYKAMKQKKKDKNDKKEYLSKVVKPDPQKKIKKKASKSP